MTTQDRAADEPTRVLLIDDHNMFRKGLARMLVSRGDVEVVGEAPNDEGAVTLAERTKPDVVVMEVQMPFERAKESLDRMLKISPPPKVIILTVFEEPRYVRELMELGASAYLLKSTSVGQLLAAIRAAVSASNGENVVVTMPRGVLERANGGSGGVLTDRQLEILTLAARGLSNRQVAAALHLAEVTVKRHLANVYREMGVSSRGEAARKALSEGWITIRDVVAEDEEG